MNDSSSVLKAVLKTADPVLKHYIRELKLENAKLQRKIVKLEVKNISNQNRIVALKKDADKRPTHEERLAELI